MYNICSLREFQWSLEIYDFTLYTFYSLPYRYKTNFGYHKPPSPYHHTTIPDLTIPTKPKKSKHNIGKNYCILVVKVYTCNIAKKIS